MRQTDFLIIGGTGSLGSQIIKDILSDNPLHNIKCLSRGELKQKKLLENFPSVKCVIGDVKDHESLVSHFDGIDVCINLAALKHVDIAEANVQECIKSNLQGTINVANCCVKYGIGHCIYTSTDKAVLPINVYGMCKAVSERYLLDLNTKQTKTRFVVYRWGNVLGSRGSVLHTFKEQLLKDRVIKLTHDKMSRFWITLPEVSRFILDTFIDCKNEVQIPKMKASTVWALARAVAQNLNIKNFDIKVCGIRPGEKIHECLVSAHEGCIRSDTCDQFSKRELYELVRGLI